MAAKSNDDKQSNTPIVDVMSPYYISPSDNPGQIFVSKILRDGNYADWMEEMSNSLFAKNKIGFVDGSIPCPAKDSSEFMLWKRCNAMVKGWLTAAMEKDIRNSVKHAKTAEEIWSDLEERFGKENAPRAYELKQALTLTRQEKMSVSAYYTKLKGIWDEIQSISSTPQCDCGKCPCDLSKRLVATRENEQLYEFLLGLDDTFNTIRTQILSTKPTPSLGAAYHLVSEDEQERLVTSSRRPAVEAAAFQTHTTNQKHGAFLRAQSTSQMQGDRKEAKQEKRSCTHCGQNNHTIEYCYHLVGFPEKKKGGFKTGGKGPQAAHVNVRDCAAGCSPIPELFEEQLAKLVEFFGSNKELSKATIVQ